MRSDKVWILELYTKASFLTGYAEFAIFEAI